MTVAGLKKAILRTGFEALYFSGSHVWLRPFVCGIGAILTLHHVRPPRRDAFQPNRLLEVTPQFLEAVIVRLRRAGIDLVSLDEMHRRLTAGERSRRFACLTFDDGYRDNLEHAYPILKKHGATADVDVRFNDRTGQLECALRMAVVETVEDPAFQWTVEKARAYKPDAQVGDMKGRRIAVMGTEKEMFVG